MYSDAPVPAGGIQDAVNKAALGASDSRTAFRVYGVHCSGLGVFFSARAYLIQAFIAGRRNNYSML